MAKLIFTSMNYAGQVFELVREHNTVGRGAQNHLVIPDSSLSSAHCVILANGNEIIVRDLGSRNGTYVDGVRLNNQQSAAKHGHIVRFGSVEARLELDPPSSEDTLSDITAIHTMGRLMRDQRREQKRSKPSESPVQLAPSGPSADDGNTAILARAPQPQASTMTSPLEVTTRPPGRTTSGVVFMIATVAVLILLALLWWWLGKP
jgi:pSer/pThr/pTyr-binding forkhead associated (FHA) protein